VLSALSVAGFSADEFVFAGFAPSRSNDRKKWLSAFAGEKRAIVFFETPHRIKKTLSDISTILVNRPIIVGRELTKLHEEVLRTMTEQAEALDVLEKGEITIVLGPVSTPIRQPEQVDDKEVASYFYQLTKSGALSRRVALTQTARYFGLSTKYVFSALERQKTLASP
jgi:16S rRNA (cytidine1402-2'-O)-methyltransferase